MAAQLNKDGATGGEPVTLRMVRDSGCITEAADNIVGMWRPALGATDPRDRKALKSILCVKVIKGRTSKANTRPVELHVDFASMRISTLPSQSSDTTPEPESGGTFSDKDLPF
jgi:hypothetical protein